MRLEVLGLTAILATAAALPAQETTTQTGGVAVEATPSKALPGETVTIHGTAAIDASAPVVTIEVSTGVNARPATLTATADKEGNYSIAYDKTAQVGVYRVVAHSPSGRVADTTSFTVLTTTAMVQDVAGEIDGDFAAAQKTFQQLSAMVPTLPDSPPKAELQQRMSALQERMRELEHDMPVVRDAFEKLGNMLQKAPSTNAPLAKYTKQLRDWRARSRAERASEPELTQANTVCEQLERINEGFNWMSLLFDLLGNPLQVVNNIFYDKFATDILSGLVGAQSDEGKFAISQFLKVGLVATGRGLETGLPKHSAELPGRSFEFRATVDLTGTIVGMLGDISQFITQKLFGVQCERFTGIFSGSLHAEFFRGEMWWSYDEDIAGILDLRYPKSSIPGAPIAMTGEFLGVGTHFGVWEDAIRVLYPKLANGAMIFHVRRPPIGTPFHPAEMKLGKVAFNLLPKAFHIPVRATYDKNMITVHPLTATSDLSEHARVVYVIVSPLSLIPVVSISDLPYKDALFIISHASPDAIIELPVTTRDGKLFTAAAEMTNTSGNAAAKGKYNLEIRVCNPECP